MEVVSYGAIVPTTCSNNHVRKQFSATSFQLNDCDTDGLFSSSLWKIMKLPRKQTGKLTVCRPTVIGSADDQTRCSFDQRKHVKFVEFGFCALKMW